MQARLLVIGVGNEHRGDDVAGLIAARALRARLPELVAVVESSGEMTALMEAWHGAECVILLDAATTGAPAGSVQRLDAHAQTVQRDYFACSTHAFGVADAVELARALGELPPSLIIYGIEAESFQPGRGLSPSVARAIAELPARIAAEAPAARRMGRPAALRRPPRVS